ncbi:hypothetical protein C0992_006329 [Termitomyces sp. T32_za158]|nr:hypothetical protein C0992_006329 [Termitomyces sp. T32_za158]
MYGDPAAPAVDPYSDAYTAPPLAPTPAERDALPPRGRSRSRSPTARSNGERGFRSPYRRRSSAAPRRPPHAPIDLNGRRIRVDYSVTDRPHAPTPGEYMGHRRSARESSYRDRDRDRDRDLYRERERDHGRRDRDRERDRDYYGRDSRDWRERRSPPASRGGRYSPDYRRRRSYSRSPPRGSSPSRARDYDAPVPSAPAPAPVTAENSRW